MSELLSPYKLGSLELANRVVMAPMTRNRASVDGVPGEISATYYAQRASAGLIVTEGVQPSAMGQAYPRTPGLHTDEQQRGWARIAEAVHARDGVIFVQLMHGGRISHPKILPGGATPVAPSAVRPAGQVFTGEGLDDFVTPRAFETDELAGVAAEYADAARRAIAAGLDGVELHSANGYLLHQFLADNTNVRTDAYGGSPERRIRFVVEVARAVADAIGSDRVGVRISPENPFNDIAETEAPEAYRLLVDALNPLSLAYLHMIGKPEWELVHDLRDRFDGTFILNVASASGTEPTVAAEALRAGRADLVSFGRLYVSNPDLVERIKLGVDFTEPDPATFYVGEDRGYIDYPTVSAG